MSNTLGNFWVDFVRAILWVLLPASLIGALLLVGQGVPMNFHPYAVATTLEGSKQVIRKVPLQLLKSSRTSATMEVASSTPTPLSNFLEMLAIVLLPAALTNTFGRMVGQPRQGWVLYYVMVFLFACGLISVHWFEQPGNPQMKNVEFRSVQVQSGGNMEGKEVRFGIGGSTLTAVVTSNTATWSYNSMHDSYSSLGGMVLLMDMLLGELVFGGLGSGLYSMVMAAAIAVFLGGLMVGRTPEYLGKKIGPQKTSECILTKSAPMVFNLSTAARAAEESVTANDPGNFGLGPSTLGRRRGREGQAARLLQFPRAT